MKVSATVILLLSFILALLVSAPFQSYRLTSLIISLHSKLFIKVLGLKIRVRGEIPKQPCLLIANHVSYLDIPVIASVCPTLFTTSQEMVKRPVLGQIAYLSRCIFSDRRKFTSLLEDIKLLSERLPEITYTLFPEATSTNGELLPFKSALFTGALHAGVPAIPVAIKYSDSLVHFYGKMNLPRHYMGLVSRRLEVEVTFLSPLQAENRKAMSSEAWDRIETSLREP